MRLRVRSKSGFAAAGRADESGDFVGGDAQADVEESLLGAVEKIDLVDVHAHRQRRGGFAIASIAPFQSV